MFEFLFFTLIIGLPVVSIWARYNLECPDCAGKLEDWNVHIASTSTVWKCKICEKEWI